MRKPKQLEFALASFASTVARNRWRRRGIWRKKPGRKPAKGLPRVVHTLRPAVNPRHPLHVAIRVRKHVWNLRAGVPWKRLKQAFAGGRERFGLRLVHFSVQGNHIHLLVEATDRRALTRGMKGLGVRIAKTLNRMMRRKGAVYADRYWARPLRTKEEVRNALIYVLCNSDKHALSIPGRGSVRRTSFSAVTHDPYVEGWDARSSAHPPVADETTVAARTWPLKREVWAWGQVPGFGPDPP